jgi:hypothetical protein
MNKRYIIPLICLFFGILLVLQSSSAAAFDTFWHAQAVQAVGREFGFTRDATNVMKLGNFSPDLFGPVQDYAIKHLAPPEQEALRAFGISNAQTRAAALFLHFDNLRGELTRNSQYDAIFTELFQNTRQTLAEYGSRKGLNVSTRNILILETLGASLHTVQDFYSHSDWIHHDFNQTASLPGQNTSELSRAPTWFETRQRLGDPDHWPFKVVTGIYPPIAGVQNTHTHMNHDNSRLLYREEETPGQPLVSQAQYHNAGPMPARPGDEESISRHQQFAVATAIAASIEWVKMLERDPAAKAAIESAKTWEIGDSKLRRELQAGLALELSLSCAAGRWDGEDPPAERGALCKVMNHQVTSFLGRSNPLANGPETEWHQQVEGLVGGLAAAVVFPSALHYTGEYWDVHSRYHMLDQLTNGFASDQSQYHLNE